MYSKNGELLYTSLSGKIFLRVLERHIHPLMFGKGVVIGEGVSLSSPEAVYSLFYGLFPKQAFGGEGASEKFKNHPKNVFMVSDTLPFMDKGVQHIVLLHALERSSISVDLCLEMWRILDNHGLMMVVVPSWSWGWWGDWRIFKSKDVRRRLNHLLELMVGIDGGECMFGFKVDRVMTFGFWSILGAFFKEYKKKGLLYFLRSFSWGCFGGFKVIVLRKKEAGFISPLSFVDAYSKVPWGRPALTFYRKEGMK